MVEKGMLVSWEAFLFLWIWENVSQAEGELDEKAYTVKKLIKKHFPSDAKTIVRLRSRVFWGHLMQQDGRSDGT